MTTQARAQTEVVGGWEGAPGSGYAFISPSFDISFDGPNSLVIKPTASFLYYRIHDVGGYTRVTTYGGSLGGSYRYSTDDFSFDIGPALEVLTENDADPNGTSTHRTRLGLAYSADATYQFSTETSSNLMASYNQSDHYFWSRANIEFAVGNLSAFGLESSQLLLGPEFTFQGNADSRQVSGGAAMDMAFADGEFSLQFRAGYSRLIYSDHADDSQAYFGIGIYHPF